MIKIPGRKLIQIAQAAIEGILFITIDENILKYDFSNPRA